MAEICRIVIQGAGAMGAFFASRFADAPGFTTALVARGERHQRLKASGLVVNGRPYAFPVIHPDEASTPADLIIVALKHHHLPSAIGDLRNLVGSGTTILSVMNGLDSEELIASVYGMDKVLYAVSVGIDAVREGNQIRYTAPGKHMFGEADNTEISPRVRRVQVAFERAGIAYETPADMMRIQWWKWMVNVGVNPPSAVMRVPYGVFQRSAPAQALMETLMREGIALAKAEGVNLLEKDVADWYSPLHTLSPHGKTSMLQDIEAGRKTEIEMFAGKAVELGRVHGIPTPVNKTMLQIIRVLEENPA
jgi:2-dehydropantoate 2-reductase